MELKNGKNVWTSLIDDPMIVIIYSVNRLGACNTF